MMEKEIWDKAHNRIFELYGDMPDLRIVSRFYSEKQAFMQYEIGKYFYDLAKLRREAEEAGERLITKNIAASCLGKCRAPRGVYMYLIAACNNSSRSFKNKDHIILI